MRRVLGEEHGIDPCDLNSAEFVVAKPYELVPDFGFVDLGGEPPPAGVGLVVAVKDWVGFSLGGPTAGKDGQEGGEDADGDEEVS